MAKSQTSSMQALVRVLGVEVDVSVASRKSVRGFTVSDEQVQAYLEQGLNQPFAGKSSGSTAVRLRLRVDRLFVPNPAAAAVLTGAYPHAGATVQMLEARSGKPVGDAFTAFVGGAKGAGGQFRPGLIGAAMVGSEEQEFGLVSVALGKEIRKVLLKR